jgi:hypothetical protein
MELKCVVVRQDDERAHLTDTRVIRINKLQSETVLMALLKCGQATFVMRRLEMEKGGLKNAPAMMVERDCSDSMDHIKSLKLSVVDSELRPMSLDHDLAGRRYFLEAIEHFKTNLKPT